MPSSNTVLQYVAGLTLSIIGLIFYVIGLREPNRSILKIGYNSIGIYIICIGALILLAASLNHTVEKNKQYRDWQAFLNSECGPCKLADSTDNQESLKQD